MTTIALQSLADRFWLNFWIVKSWFEQGFFHDEKTWTKFFEENRDMIEAKPFVKWVGGKRQLIKQLELLFPEEFNNYFEPFIGWGAVFFNLQKKQSFLSDINAELINTYQIIKTSPLKLIQFLETLEFNKECYTKIRSWDRESNWQEKYSKIERAWRFLFLKKIWFS